MFNATYFTYDGVYSGIYGLRIASFNGSGGAEETSILTPTLSTLKTSRAKRFLYSGIKYEDAPEFSFSIVSDDVLSDIARREILLWLTGKPGFRKLHIHQPDLEQYYYKCVFTNISSIFVSGHCVGFTVSARFDSIYGYGENKKHQALVSAVSFEDDTQAGTTIRVVNDTDVVDGYVYPIIKIIPVNVGEKISKIAIRNNTDTSGDWMEIDLPEINSEEACGVIIDNEIKNIKYEDKTMLKRFSKHWVRLKRGVNVLEVKTDVATNITVEFADFVLIGF